MRKIHKQEWRQKEEEEERLERERRREMLGLKSLHHQEMLGLAFPDIPKSRIRREGQRWKKENARIAKKERRGAIAKKVVDIYSHDLDYRFLYEGVLYFFAVFLKTDMQHLNYRLTRKINLAAKWCPSTDSSFDRSTMLSEYCEEGNP